MAQREFLRARTFARDRRSWLATLLLAAAAWVGTTAWLNRHVTLAARKPAAQGDDGRFAVLAFDRILATPAPRHLDRIGLREQLRALARAGYQAVTLAELRDALDGKAPLPSKPLLLSFDEGYLSTYEAVDPVLRELRWPAVMFLRTERPEVRDVAYLFWDRLARMIESGLWEVGSGDPPGPSEAEPPGVHLIAERLGPVRVPAWAPRGRDPLAAGTPGAAGPPAWLGFVDDVAGANRREADRRRIGRLRVDPAWSADELIARLDRALAAAPLAGTTSEALPAAFWVAGEGQVVETAGTLRLEGAPRAEIWIPGALWADDWVLEATLVSGSGEFWVVQPGASPGREWRFGGVDGMAYLQDRASGRPPDVLLRKEIARATGAAHRLRMVRRGAGVWITWDGEPVAPAPIVLPGRWRGKLGIVAYGREGPARLEVKDVRFAARPFVVRSVPATLSADEVRLLAQDAAEIAALCPPWAIVEGGELREEPIDRDLFQILARRYAWDVLPAVVVQDQTPPEAADAAWTAAFAQRVRASGFSGVSLDVSSVSAASREGWSPLVRELDLALARSGGRLVVAENAP